jgi:hypothetical protein
VGEGRGVGGVQPGIKLSLDYLDVFLNTTQGMILFTTGSGDRQNKIQLAHALYPNVKHKW